MTRAPSTSPRWHRFGIFALLGLLVGLGCACQSTSSVGTGPWYAAPRIEFTGNASISGSDLVDVIRPEMKELEGRLFEKRDIDDLAYSIELHYRSLGFAFAYVDYAFEAPNTPSSSEGGLATFLVSEGARIQVLRFSVSGMQAPGFSKADLQELIAPLSTSLLGSDRRWFVRSNLASGIREFESRYLAEGFLDVEIDEPVVIFSEDPDPGTVELQVTVREGPRYRFTEARVELVNQELDSDVSIDLKLAPGLPRELRHLHTDAKGQALPFTPRLANGLRAYLYDWLGRSGYPDAAVTIDPQRDEANGSVVVTFNVRPGPKITITAVEFRGNVKSSEAFLLSRVPIEPGDTYDLDAMRSGFRRLFATQLFRRVDFDLELVPGSAAGSGERILVVTVIENPSREVYVEPGFGSYEGLRVKVGAVDKNVFGTGRSLQAETTLSTKYQRFLVAVRDRSLFGFDMSGGLSSFFSRREEPSFTHEELGSGVDLGWEWPRHDLELVLGYGFRSTDVVDVEVQSPELGEFLSNIDISSLTLTLGRDTRDHYFLPKAGSRTRFQVEWSDDRLGSEVNFLASGIEHSSFVELPWEGAVFGVGIDTGVIAPTDGENSLPLQVRLFNGGATTVRSFKESELGPVDKNGEALGGQTFSVVSAELRQNLVGNLSGALFYDAGNLAPSYRDYFEFNGMRQAIGIGLRYLLPIGPARVDFGLNPDPGEREDDWVLQFAVGLAF